LGSHGPASQPEFLYGIVDILDQIANETGKTVAQVSLNWLLQRPTVDNIIIGARNEEQLKQNLGAVGWNLTIDQVKRLDEASDVTPIYPYWHQRSNPEFYTAPALY
jgi:aryl-alcohol dehydrogenase-like predicted oxidoreductase